MTTDQPKTSPAFTERLALAKKAKHLTDTDLAKMLGITRQAMVRRRLGQTHLRPREIAPMAVILDMNYNQLVHLMYTGHPDGAQFAPGGGGAPQDGLTSDGALQATIQVHHCTPDCIGTHTS